MPDYTATCHTGGCGNENILITMIYDPAYVPSVVYCGACSQPIADVAGLPAP